MPPRSERRSRNLTLMFAVRLALIATGIVEAVTAAWVLGCTSCALPILVGRELSVNAPALPSIVAQLGAVRCALALFILTAGAVTVSTDVLHKFAVCAAVHVCVLQPFVLTSARSSPCLPRERALETSCVCTQACARKTGPACTLGISYARAQRCRVCAHKPSLVCTRATSPRARPGRLPRARTRQLLSAQPRHFLLCTHKTSLACTPGGGHR